MGQQCPPTSSQGVRKPIEARFNRKQWDSQSPTHTHEHALDRGGAPSVGGEIVELMAAVMNGGCTAFI